MAGLDLVVVEVAAGATEVGAVMPLVKGMPAVPVLAPEYAGVVVEALTCGLLPVALGLRTLQVRKMSVDCPHDREKKT